METEIENIYKNTISNDKDKELLMIFLMKDFIKNHSLEKLSDQIFGDLVKNDFIKSENFLLILLLNLLITRLSIFDSILLIFLVPPFKISVKPLNLLSL